MRLKNFDAIPKAFLDHKLMFGVEQIPMLSHTKLRLNLFHHKKKPLCPPPNKSPGIHWKMNPPVYPKWEAGGLSRKTENQSQKLIPKAHHCVFFFWIFGLLNVQCMLIFWSSFSPIFINTRDFYNVSGYFFFVFFAITRRCERQGGP